MARRHRLTHVDTETPVPAAEPATKEKRRVGRPFEKGDPRINRKGRPRSFDALRNLAQEIAHEIATRNNEPVLDGQGNPITVAELIMRQWATSREPALQQKFVEIAFGKVPQDPAPEPKVPGSILPAIPADLIAGPFLDVYRDIKNEQHTEYVLYGGRGSTKSSFTSIMFIYLLINHPNMHGIAFRQVANTLRDSVYSQLLWAINVLGLSDKFKMTLTPMEMEYTPTHQKIFFRGADDPSKLKSIKPPFGYIGISWFEELDGFYGPESVRKIEQSVMRGGDKFFNFKTFNPPRTMNSWANQYVRVQKDSQLQHKSDYLSVPRDWLGEPFLLEAEHLKKVNPDAYEHEYMGNPNFSGGMVFNNVQIRPITDEEIYGVPDNLGNRVGGFEQPMNGLDFGFYPDPAHYVKCYYDAARMTLYVYKEVRKWKTSNEQMYEAIKKEGDYEDWELLICDSAEPKSVADFRSYGALARGAEKGKESLRYSMKWLQSLSAIVIDQTRAPYTAKEFLEYEFERTRDDEIISAYPDINNHGIDAVRYATNHIWRRRGE